MYTLAKSQIKVLSQFLSNMAVVWFAAAFVGSGNLILSLQYSLTGVLALVISLYLAKEVSEG